MSIGPLRHRITIQKKEIVEKNGDREAFWSDVKTVWCGIKPFSVKDFIASRAEQHQIALRVVMPHTNDIDDECRLYHAGTQLYYRIVGILPDQDSGKIYLTIACEKGVYEWEDLP